MDNIQGGKGMNEFQTGNSQNSAKQDTEGYEAFSGAMKKLENMKIDELFELGHFDKIEDLMRKNRSFAKEVMKHCDKIESNDPLKNYLQNVFDTAEWNNDKPPTSKGPAEI